MIVRYLELIFITLFCCAKTSSFVFEDEGRSYRGQLSEDARAAPVGRRPSSSSSSSYSSRNTKSTIDDSFQIPLAFIESTSSLVQSVFPNNANAISQITNIPVRTLQAVGNLVRDMIPTQQSDSQDEADSQQDEQLETLTKIRQQQLQQQLQIQQQQQQLQTLQGQPQQDEHSAHRRHIFDGSWASAFKDLFFWKFGHQDSGGYGNLFENNVYFVNGGPSGVRPEQGYHGHKKGKKKKKHKRGHHGGHKGAQYYNDDDYDDYIDNIQPLGIFSWQPTRFTGRIQNKIAPGFNDQSRIRF
ncbi:hypothetical protein PV326_004227 [Microctonus aethiopoides]|uniref:Uncharacterized protein n=1 Tax=Microctonus aethiopoides TaxID=144406 RepID=A0AA39KT64_9HYME|nr:hypothetical protein PV326_004227 [Microctonus aethiopoides]KAK0172691.1 hypothetical protein PV328_005980 [Microctonus aethiopoides]